ncbi:MAG: hypothetical protein ND866_11685 [Pyrinomonadaceae bacterium]|nr:hypothetical protein [Pyrinomonadaceae bacterium]
MDIKKFTLHRSSRRKARKGDTAKLAAQLAPLEELAKPSAVKQVGIDSSSGNGQAVQDSGAIIVDKDLSHVPRDMMEEGGEKTFLGMEPVVLVILAVMLTFIAFIAWQITQMPAK